MDESLKTLYGITYDVAQNRVAINYYTKNNDSERCALHHTLQFELVKQWAAHLAWNLINDPQATIEQLPKIMETLEDCRLTTAIVCDNLIAECERGVNIAHKRIREHAIEFIQA